MNKRFDVLALGELLIDFTENGQNEQGNPLLEANPGGAPCNVLAMLQKLGKHTAFIGKVGKDMFGTQLRQAAEDAGICMDYLLEDEVVHTTLAFVKTFPNGDRDFSFYREPGADMMLRGDELPLGVLRNTRIFHFGTLSMTHPEVRFATRKAVTLAKEAEALISFDPNLRPPLWHDLEEAREQIKWGLSRCDILKIADNELEFMTGETDFDRGAAALCACVLNYVLENGIEELEEDRLGDMLRFANAAAYLVTTKKGAIRSMPEREQVLAILANH